MPRWTLGLLTVLIILSTAAAAERLIVREIEFQGNKLTRRWVLERELGFSTGDTLTTVELEAARKRLDNLVIFNSVHLDADRSTGKVTILVSEAWPLWPIFNVSLSEGQISDVLSRPRSFFRTATVEAGAAHLNILGSGGRPYAAAQFGAAQGFDVGYQTRWLAPGIPLAFEAHFQSLRSQSRHSAVTDTARYLRDVQYEIDISTRRGAPFRPGIHLAYKAINHETEAPPVLRDARTWWASPYIILDRRDLEWFPTRGSLAGIGMDVVGGHPSFVRSFYDLRGYFPIYAERERPWCLALRFNAATSTNSTPEWAHYYFGFNSALRGYSSLKSESSTFMLGDVELRVPIGRESTYDVPLIGRWGKRWPWGVWGLLYAQRGELTLNGGREQRQALGAGCYFRFPWVQIIETSLSVRSDGSTDFLARMGVGF